MHRLPNRRWVSIEARFFLSVLAAVLVAGTSAQAASTPKPLAQKEPTTEELEKPSGKPELDRVSTALKGRPATCEQEGNRGEVCAGDGDALYAVGEDGKPSKEPLSVRKVNAYLDAKQHFGKGRLSLLSPLRLPSRPGADPKDATSNFMETLKAVQSGSLQADPKKLNFDTMVFVRGLHGDTPDKMEKGYFKDWIDRCKELGKTCHDSAIGTQGRIEDSIETLRKDVAEQIKDGKKVRIMAHSRGGSVALGMYLRLSEAQRKEVSIDFVQAALGGSQLANVLARSKLLREQTGMNDAVAALPGLTTHESGKRMVRASLQLGKDDYKRFRTVTSNIGSREAAARGLLKSHSILEERCGANDGYLCRSATQFLDPRTHASLTQHVHLKGVEHEDSVMPGKRNPVLTSRQFFETLLLLQR